MYSAGDPSPLAVVRAQGASALAAVEALQARAVAYQPAAEYPKGQLGSRLRTIAQLIVGGAGTRVYSTTVGGFDDHAAEKNQHAQLLAQVDQALAAFWADLEAHGVADRVTLLAWSEFGRRVRENASGGTDHGAAGPVFVMGPRVRGGLIGDHPSLDDLWDGDLKYGIDFRSVYQAVLAGWMGAPGRDVLGGTFEAVPLFRV